MRRWMHLLIVGVVFGLTSQLSASLITTVPVGVTTTFPVGSGDGCVGESTAIVAGFSIHGSGPWCHERSVFFNFDTNGNWTDFGLVAVNTSTAATSTVTINLGGLFGTVGGFMNYCPSADPDCQGVPLIEALALDGLTVLESYNLAVSAPISTPSGQNEGAFRGISRVSPDIAFFRISGNWIAMHDITLADSAVPEPATGLLAFTALTAIGLMRRRRKR